MMQADMLKMTLQEFLDATAAKQPAPGGGAVAALAGALGAALASMAVNYTVGRKGYAAYEAEVQSALGQFERARALLKELVVEDVEAYQALFRFLKMPEEQRKRDADYPAVVVAAIRVPETVGGIA